MVKDILKEEGLFITEFSDNFFDEYINQDIKLKEIIQNIADKTMRLQEEAKENIWHCILHTVLEEICPQGLAEYFDLEKYNVHQQFYNMLSEFYKDSFFLEMDVSQAILYNLYRCDGKNGENYDLNKEYERFKKWDLDELIKEYGELFSYGRGKKDHYVDLVSGLELLRKNCEKQKRKAKVYFSQLTEDNILSLDRSFPRLNVLYIGNDKFQDYLYHIKKRKEMLQSLQEYIKKLDKDSNSKPLHYIWEKMTDFNTINIIAKFLVERIESERINEKDLKAYEEWMTDNYAVLFRRIEDMPNILTRLLILKQAFSYILKNSTNLKGMDISGMLLNELTQFLAKINGRYKDIRDIILEVAVLVRWKIEAGEELDIEQWIKELETEYSVDLFETLYVSLNIDDSLYKAARKHDCGKFEEEKIEENKCLTVGMHSGIMDGFEYLKRCDLLKVIKEQKFINDKIKLAKILKEQGWLVTERYYAYLGQANADAYENTYIGRICTKVYNEKEAKEYSKKYQEETKYIEEIIRPYLLSEDKNIIFENPDIKKFDEYTKVFDLLLYHFYI